MLLWKEYINSLQKLIMEAEKAYTQKIRYTKSEFLKLNFSKKKKEARREALCGIFLIEQYLKKAIKHKNGKKAKYYALPPYVNAGEYLITISKKSFKSYIQNNGGELEFKIVKKLGKINSGGFNTIQEIKKLYKGSELLARYSQLSQTEELHKRFENVINGPKNRSFYEYHDLLTLYFRINKKKIKKDEMMAKKIEQTLRRNEGLSNNENEEENLEAKKDTIELLKSCYANCRNDISEMFPEKKMQQKFIKEQIALNYELVEKGIVRNKVNGSLFNISVISNSDRSQVSFNKELCGSIIKKLKCNLNERREEKYQEINKIFSNPDDLIKNAIEELAKIHRIGKAHRDVKFENIMLSEKNELTFIDLDMMCMPSSIGALGTSNLTDTISEYLFKNNQYKDPRLIFMQYEDCASFIVSTMFFLNYRSNYVNMFNSAMLNISEGISDHDHAKKVIECLDQIIKYFKNGYATLVLHEIFKEVKKFDIEYIHSVLINEMPKIIENRNKNKKNENNLDNSKNSRKSSDGNIDNSCISDGINNKAKFIPHLKYNNPHNMVHNIDLYAKHDSIIENEDDSNLDNSKNSRKSSDGNINNSCIKECNDKNTPLNLEYKKIALLNSQFEASSCKNQNTRSYFKSDK